MKHEWKGGMTTSTPDSPPEGYSYCENCGAEEADDNPDEECATESAACPYVKQDADGTAHCDLAETGIRVFEAKWKDAERRAEDWHREYLMFAHAWQRELGGKLRSKSHLIDALVVTTEEMRRSRGELLAACEFVKEFLQKLEDDGGYQDPLTEVRRNFHAPLHEKLDAAIARAKGKETK